VDCWASFFSLFYPPEILEPAITQQPWPKIADHRFAALGEDIHYRVLYAAMCSQTHNDGEDLLNEMVNRVVNDPRIERRLLEENFCAGRDLTYGAAEFILQAGIEYTSLYGMDRAHATCSDAKNQMRQWRLHFFDRFHKAPGWKTWATD
jgi:hypothetical protein